ISERVRALNKVDLPTLGKPTIPSVRLTRIILTHTNAGVAEWAACSLNSWHIVQYRTVSSNDSQTPEQGDGEHSMSQNRSDDHPDHHPESEQTALAQAMTTQELEKLQLSGKFDHSTDVERLEAISPHPPGDQVDRTVVAGGMIKSASLWAIRLVVIGFFLYLLGEIIGSFWQGILPVVLSLIVCTVL